MALITVSNNSTATYSGCIVSRIKEISPNTNYNTDVEMEMTSFSAGDRSFTLLQLNGLNTVPEGGTVSNARIKINAVNLSNSNLSFEAIRCLRTVVQTEVTWNNFSTGNLWATAGGLNTTSDIGAVDLANLTIPVTTTNAYYELTGAGLTQWVQDVINGVITNPDLMLRPDPQNAHNGTFAGFVSDSGADGRRPELVFDYVVAGGTDIIGTSTSTNTNTSILTGIANVVGTSTSAALLSATIAISGGNVLNLVGTSAPDYGTSAVFDSLLINSTDVLYINNFNDTLSTSNGTTTYDFLINNVDSLYINSANDKLIISSENVSNDVLSTNNTNTLYINSANDGLALSSTPTQNASNPNPSYGTLEYTIRYNGQSVNNSTITSSVLYALNLTGTSGSEITTSNDYLLTNSTDTLYINLSNDSLFINGLGGENLNQNYASLIANYFGTGSSYSSTNAFFVSPNTIVNFTGTSFTTSTNNGIGRFVTNSFGNLVSNSANSAINSSISRHSGQSNSTTNIIPVVNYRYVATGILNCASTLSSTLRGIFNGIGLSNSITPILGQISYLYRARGSSTSLNTNTTKISASTSQIGNSNSISTNNGFIQYSNVLIGESLSTTNSVAIFSGLYDAFGLSESYSNADGYSTVVYSLIGTSNDTNTVMGIITGTYHTLGLVESNSTINGVISGRTRSVGLSNSNTAVNSTLSALYRTRGLSTSNSFISTTPIFETYIVGNSLSNTSANAIAIAPINLTGTLTSNSNLNAPMDARINSRGISTSNSNIQSIFAYSYKLSGEVLSTNINTARLTGSYNLIGNSNSNNTLSGGIRLLGLTSPTDQAYLNELLLNSPDRRVKALKESKFVVLDRNAFI